MEKTAIIVGDQGQDGILLRDFLISKGYSGVGIAKDQTRSWGKVNFTKTININHKEDIKNLFEAIKPDEVYFLAAYHHSSQEKVVDESLILAKSMEVHVISLQIFLENIRLISPETHLFYAASSLIFGNCQTEIQTEESIFQPNELYGITKLSGLQLCKYYQEKYNVFASVGILYNHESPLRKNIFLSKKITEAVVNIKKGLQEKLFLGNLEAVVDWGYANDFVEAFYLILQHKESDIFIVSTNKGHQVVDFVSQAFECAGLDWRNYVEVKADVLVRKSITRIGDYSKLNKATGWFPKTSFEQMVKILIETELNEK